MFANPSKSEVCYLMQPKTRKTKADLFSMSKAFPIKHNHAKVGILYDINQARKKNEKDNRPR